MVWWFSESTRWNWDGSWRKVWMVFGSKVYLQPLWWFYICGSRINHWQTAPKVRSHQLQSCQSANATWYWPRRLADISNFGEDDNQKCLLHVSRWTHVYCDKYQAWNLVLCESKFSLHDQSYQSSLWSAQANSSISCWSQTLETDMVRCKIFAKRS